MTLSRFAFALCWLLIAAPAAAQIAEEQDPYAEASDAEETTSPWRPFADLQLRGDRVTGLPAGRADLERARAQLRLGVTWDDGGTWSTGFAANGHAGSDENRDNVRNNDNRRSNGVRLDQAWLRLRTRGGTQVQLGKASLPLALTPMLWDADLRPVGASLTHSRTNRGFDRWEWQAFAADVDHPLASGPRMYAAQLGWHRHEGAPLSFSAIATYLDFERLGPLARAGLGRGNPILHGAHRDDYRIADLQLVLRGNPENGRGWEMRLDLLRNTAATRASDAARVDLAWGGMQPREWQWQYAYQRIQAAAVLAALNSDDWWFHAGARGHMLAAAYAFDETWRARITAFSETRDGLDQPTRRLLLDLEARW